MRYERLSNFCFNCGLMSHTVRNCPQIAYKITVAMCKQFSYEFWLTGSTDKGELLHFVALEAFMECGAFVNGEEEVHVNMSGGKGYTATLVLY